MAKSKIAWLRNLCLCRAALKTFLFLVYPLQFFCDSGMTLYIERLQAESCTKTWF